MTLYRTHLAITCTDAKRGDLTDKLRAMGLTTDGPSIPMSPTRSPVTTHWGAHAQFTDQQRDALESWAQTRPGVRVMRTREGVASAQERGVGSFDGLADDVGAWPLRGDA